ncbi:MFS transporter [Leptolyngbya sp. 'hensonii']|uniref:BCD family MFS transporter n=1 Tax=Leptolyngbya sp. 'hensonii' TaxID=1922337 RepID=UPI00094FDCD8|nr:BCD family MFS transporter [Leptolyngbya sp. 'hensonii']OLP18355.1 MFS transporter [Leptolyngbya sp. 'hensonii']
MTPNNLADSQRPRSEAPGQPPRINLGIMLRLGLFQMGLGMMSVLLFGLLNRVLIKELGVPATIASVVLAVTLFVAPLRVWFGQLSDTRPLFGLHRTGYVLCGAVSFATIAFVAVQVMWQVGANLQSSGWSSTTYAWTALLAFLFGLYGIAVSACSTPFATLLVDVTDEEDRSRIVGVDWAMLIGGTIIGGITIGVMLKKLGNDPSLELLQSSINRLFLVIPWIVVGLAVIATWNVERQYSRFTIRTQGQGSEQQITLGRAWGILTASRQTRFFFTFLVAMTLGLFLQDAILEPFGGEVFKMPAGATATLNAFWGTGTLIGILGSGFFLAPRYGKRQTAKLGCQGVVLSLVLVIAAGFAANPQMLQLVLLIFGLASGIATTGAITLMLDLTAAETAGTFIGAWGLAQALARGLAAVIGGTTLDLGKKLTTNLVLAYGTVFLLQGLCMLLAIALLSRVNVQEFQTTSREAIANVLAADRD